MIAMIMTGIIPIIVGITYHAANDDINYINDNHNNTTTTATMIPVKVMIVRIRIVNMIIIVLITAIAIMMIIMPTMIIMRIKGSNS